MSERDEQHWLWRFSATDWLAAAGTELEQGRARVESRRAAVTHARRAAGMALNGALVAMAARGWPRARCEQIWGRSYIDHLRALAKAGEDAQLREPFDAEFCERCAALLAINVMPAAGHTGLVMLSRSKDDAGRSALELAEQLQRACAALLGD